MSVDPETLRARFDARAPMTVGVEEELMLLDPATLDLAPRAREVLDAVGAEIQSTSSSGTGGRFTLELPASQLEIVLAPQRTAGEAVAELVTARRALVDAVNGEVRFAAAGVHPFAAPLGVLNA